MKLDDVVDLTRYPIEAPDSAEGRTLLEACREAFTRSVLLELPGFLQPAAVSHVLHEVQRARSREHCYQMERSAYDLDDAPPGVPNDPLNEVDPRNERHRRHQSFLGGDELASDSPLRRLFAADPFTEFLRGVLNETIHPVADPVMDVCIAISAHGDEIGWHFDSHRYSVTVLLQEPGAGGVFEHVPRARQGQENFDRVPNVFSGRDDNISRTRFRSGSLMLFRGIDTLHRLTPIVGEPSRILGLLSYDAEPGRVFSDGFRRAVLGRTG